MSKNNKNERNALSSDEHGIPVNINMKNGEHVELTELAKTAEQLTREKKAEEHKAKVAAIQELFEKHKPEIEETLNTHFDVVERNDKVKFWFAGGSYVAYKELSNGNWLHFTLIYSDDRFSMQWFIAKQKLPYESEFIQYEPKSRLCDFTSWVTMEKYEEVIANFMENMKKL